MASQSVVFPAGLLNEFLIMGPRNSGPDVSRRMDVLALATILLLLLLPEPGDFNAGGNPKLIFCPGFREVGPEDKGRSDPIWLLQKDEEWIPFRTEHKESPMKESYQSKMKFFGCFLYHLSAFSHYVLDFFFPPFYGFPYYRVAVEFDPSAGYSVSDQEYDSPPA